MRLSRLAIPTALAAFFVSAPAHAEFSGMLAPSAIAAHQQKATRAHHARSYTIKGDITITITRRNHRASTGPHDANENRAEIAAGSGIIRSHKTGASARVSPRAAAAMQSMINDLEQNYGATVRFVGGYRNGSCPQGEGRHYCLLRHQHFFGLAMDVCQTSRGVVDPRCNLPAPAIFHRIARAHGLYEGSVWCNTDYGHVQFINSGGCNIAAHGRGDIRLATLTGKVVEAGVSHAPRHWHRHHYRVARR